VRDSRRPHHSPSLTLSFSLSLTHSLLLFLCHSSVSRSLAFSLSLSLSSSVIPLLFQRCPSDTLNLPLYLSLSISLSFPLLLSLSPLSRPSSGRSFSLPPPSIPFTFLTLARRGRLARTCEPRTSAFLSAKRRTGFRRKETTIRRIVATDHSWRVDRINEVN